ncbi:hypothetical protein C7S20_19320 [Christiangramia fulva]|uniref:Transcriptional regulator n=1 Tax=Christiangramia fulva TaxID=2126553 RepID=A0A2R3ZAC1_9FLAO|nr:Lrp/AsnC family transcriptional regulator [Christiangramia fulva]AVR47229.1 hypothetical protein C7S20_19320 [Christiangramia fulva]
MKTTSIEAHEFVKDKKSRMHKNILQTLRVIGKGSFRDMAHAGGLKEAQVWKRLSEMKELGYIVEVGIKVCPESNRKVTVWAINESKQLSLL